MGLIVMFIVAELRKSSNEEIIRSIMQDPVPLFARELEQAILKVDAELAWHFVQVDDPNNADITFVKESLDKIAAQESILSSFLVGNAFEAEEHVRENEMLRIIKVHIQTLRELPRDQLLIDWRQHIDALTYAARIMTEAVELTHIDETNKLFRQIERSEKERAVLAIIVLMGVFVVVLYLFDLIYHFKASAERAKAAEKCNALFAAALQNTRVGVLIRDMKRPNKPIVFLNKAFTRITGYDFQDVADKKASDFLFGWNTSEDAIASFRRAMSLQETTTIEALLYRKDGAPFWSEWHLTPLMGDDGTLAYFVSLFSDTTSLRQTQEDLLQAKTMAEHASAVKTSFLAMMSHEIRTPINGILGILKLLNEANLTEEQKHLVTIATSSSNALHGIINDILDFAKMEAGKVEVFYEAFDLRPIVEEIVGLARSLLGEKKVDLVIDIADNVPHRFICDAGRIRQVLLNLVSNAVKFTDTGFIKIRVYPLMQQEINGHPGYLMRFEVQDTGAGISVGDQNLLFKEFSQIQSSYTRKHTGTGLGLAICKRLIVLLKGEIGVESLPGKGSKFWFLLPMQEVTAVDQLPPIENEGSSIENYSANIKVLLVEDNETNRIVARRYVEKLKATVDEAVNGFQAVEKAKANIYDLILMDVSMPEMDGMMATRQIRSLGGRNAVVPIIALTAHAMVGDKQLCLESGMNDYLNKPLEYPKLVQAFRKWVKGAVQDSGSIDDANALDIMHRESDKENTAIPSSQDYQQFLVFDERVLDNMKVDLGPGAVDEITRTFLNDSLRRIADIKESSNLYDIQLAAHTLKSCSANCGLIRFSKMMASLESEAMKHNEEGVRVLLSQTQESYDLARGILEKERMRFVN